MGRRWNPWAALRARTDVVLVRTVPLAGPRGLAVVFPDGEQAVAVDPGLGRVERRCVLAHELVHHERGILPAGAPGHVVAREEARVDGEAARPLVPSDELRAVASSLLEVAEAVEAWQLAKHFDVTEAVIHRRAAEFRRGHRL